MANILSQTAAEPSLSAIPGTLVLVGAGKMGGAMLEGWLRLGLEPRGIVVLDPQPSAEVQALAGNGLRLNPSLDSIADVAVLVLAVKPQTAPEVLPALKP